MELKFKLQEEKGYETQQLLAELAEGSPIGRRYDSEVPCSVSLTDPVEARTFTAGLGGVGSSSSALQASLTSSLGVLKPSRLSRFGFTCLKGIFSVSGSSTFSFSFSFSLSFPFPSSSGLLAPFSCPSDDVIPGVLS